MVTATLPLPLSLDLGSIAGTTLWALSLYLGFSPVADRVIDGCHRWIQTLQSGAKDEAMPSLSPNTDSPGQTAPMAVASLLSVVPFLALGGVAHYGLTLSLGGSWAVSLGIIAFMVGGIYELGRQSSQI